MIASSLVTSGLFLSSTVYTLTSLTSLCWLGGEEGAAGLNLLHRADGRVLNLGAKTSISLQPGVRLCNV